MFKLILLVLAALVAVAFASPVVYSTHIVQPVVRTHYAAAPLVRRVLTPVISAPVSQHVYYSAASAPIIGGSSVAYTPLRTN